MPLKRIEYHSSALQRNSYSWVIIPEGANPFPVLYLLHGLPDRPGDWLRRSSIVAITSTLPLAVVMPEGGGLYCGNWERYIVDDLPRVIEERINAIPRRESRGIAGISIGGYGAMKLAFKYPDRFSSVSSHSGALGWGHRPMDGEASWRELLRERRGRLFSGGFLYRLAMSAPFRRKLAIYKRLEEMRRRDNDLYAIIPSAPDKNRPRVLVDCGMEDFLIGDNRAFHDYLSEIAVDHEYHEFHGAHNWSYWNARMTDIINFHARSMNLLK